MIILVPNATTTPTSFVPIARTSSAPLNVSGCGRSDLAIIQEHIMALRDEQMVCVSAISPELAKLPPEVVQRGDPHFICMPNIPPVALAPGGAALTVEFQALSLCLWNPELLCQGGFRPVHLAMIDHLNKYGIADAVSMHTNHNYRMWTISNLGELLLRVRQYSQMPLASLLQRPYLNNNNNGHGDTSNGNGQRTPSVTLPAI